MWRHGWSAQLYTQLNKQLVFFSHHKLRAGTSNGCQEEHETVPMGILHRPDAIWLYSGHTPHVNFPYSLPIHISIYMVFLYHSFPWKYMYIRRLYGNLTWSICPLSAFRNVRYRKPLCEASAGAKSLPSCRCCPHFAQRLSPTHSEKKMVRTSC